MGLTNPSELLAIPATERLELAMGLWQSLDSAELERRWSRHKQHPEEAVSWELVRRDLGLE
ncbi:MAG: addiction module protein [Synechococcus sp.]|nr:addiction module protein [Synechococcus sp.]